MDGRCLMIVVTLITRITTLMRVIICNSKNADDKYFEEMKHYIIVCTTTRTPQTKGERQRETETETQREREN